jgi:hypothetical protein
MGTVTDWHSTITRSTVRNIPGFDGDSLRGTAFAHEWRNGFFREAHAMAADGEANALNDIDAIHAKVLDELLKEEHLEEEISMNTRATMVRDWHFQYGMSFFQVSCS